MEKQLEDLKAIREMMEKSSKFLSLSGLSGVMAGVTAIAGAAVAYFYILGQARTVAVPMLIIDALLTLAISISFGIVFSARKAKKSKLKFVNSVTLKIAYTLAIPLATGGILSLILIYRDQIELVAAITLIFYGLGLVHASKYTLDEIHYLGITEIILGILAAIFLYHGIIFWTIGFGLCHIIYGLIMYKKYDLKK
jgi:predicted lysophospholipase L1 biosynthesis ABC-type transport system permease subunit